MAHDEDLTELIDAYLQGTLEFDELEKFERRMREDESFRQEVEAQQFIIKSIRHEIHHEMRMRLKDIHREMKAEQNNTGIDMNTARITSVRSFSALKYWKYGAAAGVALLLTATYIVWRHGETLFKTTQQEMATAQMQSQYFKIPYVEKGTQTQGYARSNNNATSESSDAAAPVDSLIVSFNQSEGYARHYEFIDTLKIYSTSINASNRLRVEYDSKTDEYWLVVDAARYEIEKGFKGIKPLKN